MSGWRLRSRQPAAESEAPDVEVRLQSGWTWGAALATRAAGGLLWCALLTGPLALAWGVAASLAGPAASPQAVASPVDEGAGGQAAVEEFAQRFVVTWLQTPRGSESMLAGYVDVAELALPQTPWEAAFPATARVGALGEGMWSVTVGVTVSGPPGEPSTSGPAPRRYFQVPVLYRGGGLVAQALPAPVAAPPAAAAVPLGYRYRAAPGGPVTAAVGEFLTALLTGTGDVTRYVAPGRVIRAVDPAPYVTVEVLDVAVDEDVPAAAAPRDGEEVRALVTARAAVAPTQQTTVQYPLTLTARAGRWEVRSVDDAPATRPAAPPAGGPATDPPSTAVPGARPAG